MSPKSGRTGVARRRRVTFATMLVAAFVVPVAIAYACNPQAHVSLDKTSYQPGSTITVYGSYFPATPTVTVSGPTGSVPSRPRPGGGFTTTLTAPSTPGNYTITAIAADGRLRPRVVHASPPRLRRHAAASRALAAPLPAPPRQPRRPRRAVQDAERRPQRGPGLR